IKVQAEILYTKIDSNYISQKANILLYFERDSVSELLQIGDELVTQFACDSIKNSGNPFEFDVKTYMARQQIFYSAYVPIDTWDFAPLIISKSLNAYAIAIRNYLADIYRKNNISGNELGILSALTLGYKADIDPSVQDNYVITGTMHVLSVSGLHVGVIFIILQTIVRIPPTNQRNRVVKFLIIAAALWLFAFITGFSASVNRAALMFSLVQLGLAINRRSSIYNTLASSAFILLLIEPNYLYNIGFQLSYIAVFAIVYLQPKLENLYYFENNYLRQIWVLLTVSIAAQIGTSPISMYYFGIFPNYFWLANLPIVPLSSLLMYGSVVLLSVSPFEFLSVWVAKFEYWGVWLMNFIAEFVGKLPYAVTKGISISGFEVFVFYIVILFLIFFLQKRNALYLLTFLLFISTWAGFMLVQSFQTKTELVVFNSKKAPVWCLRHKKELLLFTNNRDDANFTLSGYLRKRNINESVVVTTDSAAYSTNFFLYRKPFARFAGKTIVQITKPEHIEMIANHPFAVDYAIISGNPEIEMEYLMQFCSPKLVIMDASNYKNRIENWQKELAELDIEYYTIAEKGAFIVQF
ncbi:MAG TPA: hypothetical protein DCQ31_14075, partial [Bacteroidales bacterium]|nr:hypothetical protein [Bacteroidales bacterium]